MAKTLSKKLATTPGVPSFQSRVMTALKVSNSSCHFRPGLLGNNKGRLPRGFHRWGFPPWKASGHSKCLLNHVLFFFPACPCVLGLYWFLCLRSLWVCVSVCERERVTEMREAEDGRCFRFHMFSPTAPWGDDHARHDGVVHWSSPIFHCYSFICGFSAKVWLFLLIKT